MLVLAKWMAEQGCEVTSGFSHYFEWLGGGSMAKCRAQWGDNHCYQYQFDDNSASSTISIDSRGLLLETRIQKGMKTTMNMTIKVD